MKRTRMKPGKRPTYDQIKARKRSAYKDRPRDTPRMLFVKTMICSVVTLPPPWCARPTPCAGVMEADHMRHDHGLSHKGHDDGVAPMCNLHHRERTDGCGTFKLATKFVERSWRELAIENARIQYELHAAIAAPNH